MNKGKVYLVGAGPGDPKLITIRALEALRRSDVVVYDRLANPRLLKHLRRGGEKIYVGKLPDRHTMKQEEINQLLLDLALAGKTVTRLKGGDPAVFGRVGEEAELLAAHGVDYEWIPGITSAIAVPAYAGIPVTHRDITPSFSIITGHEKPERLDTMINWSKVATATGTLIFLMGVAKIRHIRDQLITHGKAADTPVALIRWGTHPAQETLTGTLATIAEQVEATNFQPPAVIVVGHVVALRERLAWFEKKPLFGMRILVTRSREQAGQLADRIDDAGGEPAEYPLIRIVGIQDEQAQAVIANTLSDLSVYDWMIFTSINGVRYFFEELQRCGIDVRTCAKARIAAVGTQTANELRAFGLIADVIPPRFDAESLAEHMQDVWQVGQRVLMLRGNLAGKALPADIAGRGVEVTDLCVYHTLPVEDDADELIASLQEGEIHMATFTSSSTVDNLCALLSSRGYDPTQLLASVHLVCIGPMTARTIERHGLKVGAVSQEATIDSLMTCLIEQKSVWLEGKQQ